MKSIWAILILMTMLSSLGCRHVDSAGGAVIMMEIESIYGATQCMGKATQPQAVWIATRDELLEVWDGLHRGRLGDSTPAVPNMDFSTHGLLWIHMGQRSTGGYAIELAEPLGRIDNETAVVVVKWIEPASDAIVVQVMTAPCILLQVPTGDYDSIRVVDQNGRVRMSVVCR